METSSMVLAAGPSPSRPSGVYRAKRRLRPTTGRAAVIFKGSCATNRHDRSSPSQIARQTSHFLFRLRMQPLGADIYILCRVWQQQRNIFEVNFPFWKEQQLCQTESSVILIFNRLKKKQTNGFYRMNSIRRTCLHHMQIILRFELISLHFSNPSVTCSIFHRTTHQKRRVDVTMWQRTFSMHMVL